eukprot:CAMPEP_0202957590 /NCGR_PEP_ID=MMETSP1396-20130829/1962_1 /ASSEMBLY_ACC=CAM_ASM_000872 /TAXON_ID= /ORGANISM="Pseudokeronopsis sp., Strain Brazil" /LENGTH=44 /DNA_ID= /DNA_START= /DNA_END= /DNA_ORIENTATION=
MPFGGSVCALIFHEFIFKKTQEVLNSSFQPHSHHNEDEDHLTAE